MSMGMYLCIQPLLKYAPKGILYNKVLYMYISAWASALLVLTAMGNARASIRGTGDESSTLFYFA